MKTLVILGSARSDGNTLKAVKELCPFAHYELVDLNQLRVEPYSYNSAHDDDFAQLIKKMAEAENLVFATPVYWYAMSGLMKNFFDRFSDLLGTDLGRKLKGKNTYLIASGSDAELPPGFEVPFQMTSDYLGLKYQGSFYQRS